MEPARKGDFFVMPSPKEPRCTTADIESLPEGQRAELIDGRMYLMAPPSLHHQDILLWLSVEIFSYINAHGGKCRVIPAPFGVYIKKDKHNYFEPDISVICDKDKLDQKGCHGAPDWIIEIVSPSSRQMDYCFKPTVYLEAGVREYWIVDIDRQQITVHSLEKSLSPVVYRFGDTIKPGIYEDFTIDSSRLAAYLE